MPDLDESQPSDNFSFVDRRRVSDSTEAAEDAMPMDADGQPDLVETVSPESEPSEHSSIYDIAAYCTGLMITEGFQRLGLIANPQTGKAVMDLPSARVAIDCVAGLVKVLDEPDSTLPEAVRREMKRTLNDLRLNFVDRNRS